MLTIDELEEKGTFSVGLAEWGVVEINKDVDPPYAKVECDGRRGTITFCEHGIEYASLDVGQFTLSEST